MSNRLRTVLPSSTTRFVLATALLIGAGVSSLPMMQSPACATTTDTTGECIALTVEADKMTVSADADTVFEESQAGGLKLTKSSAFKDIAAGDPLYSNEGAVYGVFAGEFFAGMFESVREARGSDARAALRANYDDSDQTLEIIRPLTPSKKMHPPNGPSGFYGRTGSILARYGWVFALVAACGCASAAYAIARWGTHEHTGPNSENVSAKDRL